MKPNIAYYRSNYTVYIPDAPSKMVIYLNPQAMPFPHANGKNSRTLYNFQEEVAQAIFDKNPGTIGVAAVYNRDLPRFLNELITSYRIQVVVVSGWSLAGNDAIKLATEIRNVTGLVLIDSNHTNQMNQRYFTFLRGTHLLYISNTYNATKLKKTAKAFEVMPHEYLLLHIPSGFTGSNHRYCRDSSLNNNVFGFFFGGAVTGDYEVMRCG